MAGQGRQTANTSETTRLLQSNEDDRASSKDSQRSHCFCGKRKILICSIVVIGAIISGARFGRAAMGVSTRNNNHEFPKDFVWGTATSAYQVEGAVDADGRGQSIWDTYCQVEGNIVDVSSGAVACDHYDRMRQDVQLMKEMGIKAYRFSIAWPRIYSAGSGTINLLGVDFYNRLIDTLLENGIEPWATLYHWDLPQALEDQYGGWLDPQIVDDFGEYARTCFLNFGDRVRHWITINEAWTVAVQGYQDGSKAPGKTNNATFDVYRAGHNLVLAHARAARIYKNEFANMQQGKIGIANCGDFRYPKDAESHQDRDAADRAIIFQFAWLSDPLFFGDYPDEMRKALGDRLPSFTEKEKRELVGSSDFLGLNHYSTLYASVPKVKPSFGGYWTDMNVEFSSDPSWRTNYMGWSTNPTGCRELLLWISRRYAGVSIVMTENGTSEDEPDIVAALTDEGRRDYFEGYLRACAEAIEMGVPLQGYFAWSLMDNFEWEYGYTRRFGLCFVDFETLVRTPKLSGVWYSETAKNNGRNIVRFK